MTGELMISSLTRSCYYTFMSETSIYRLNIPGNHFKIHITILAPFIAEVQSAAITTETSHSHHPDDNRVIVYRYRFELAEEDILMLRLKWAEFDTHLSKVEITPGPSFQTQPRKQSELQPQK